MEAGPAGWASGISIDQEIRNHLQASEATRTRFGSLSLGLLFPIVLIPGRGCATRAAINQWLPIDDPGRMFQRLYGGAQDRKHLASILDHVRKDVRKVAPHISSEDKAFSRTAPSAGASPGAGHCLSTKQYPASASRARAGS